MTYSYTDSRKIYVKSMSPLTKKKISDSLKGRFHTLETRKKWVHQDLIYVISIMVKDCILKLY